MPQKRAPLQGPREGCKLHISRLRHQNVPCLYRGTWLYFPRQDAPKKALQNVSKRSQQIPFPLKRQKPMSQTPSKRDAHDQLQKAVRLKGRANADACNVASPADNDFRLELGPLPSAPKGEQEKETPKQKPAPTDWPWEEDHCAHRDATNTGKPDSPSTEDARDDAPPEVAQIITVPVETAAKPADSGICIEDTSPKQIESVPPAPGEQAEKPAAQEEADEICEDLACEGKQPSGDTPSEEAESPAKRRKLPKAATRALKGLCIFVLSVLVLFLGLLLAVQLNMDKITTLALQEISARTGCSIGFSGVTMRLIPLPAIRLDNVHLVLPGKGQAGNKTGDQAETQAGAGATTRALSLSARTLYFAPNFLTLLSGRFEPETIGLVEPRIVGELPIAFADLAKGGGGSGKTNLKDILPLHCSLAITNAHVTLWDRDGNLLRADGFSADITLTNLPMANPLNGLDGTVELASASLQTREYAAAAADVRIFGKAGLADPLHDMSLEVQARTAISPLSLGLATHLQLEGNRHGLGCKGVIRGNFTFDGVVIPYEFAGSVEPGSSPNKYAALLQNEPPAAEKGLPLHVALDTFALGDDVLNLDALVFPKNLAVAGRLGIERVSLTRWLTFARHLSPGLQISLDRITNGFIDFYIDTRHLRAPNIKACAAGATFKGHGGIADWKDIVIFLDMKSDFVDLGRAIPESVGRMKEPPKYAHRPLTEMSGADIFAQARDAGTLANKAGEASLPQEKNGQKEQQKEQNQNKDQNKDQSQQKARPAEDSKPEGNPAKKRLLSYDIRLGSAKIHYGYADIVEGGVIIRPGTNSKGEDSARLDMHAGLFDGKCTGYAHFSGEKETEYEFAIEVAGSSLKKLHKAMDFIPFTAGSGSCRVQVTSKGSEINRFLANLRGRVQVTGQNTVMEKAERFSPMRLACDLRLGTAAFQNSALGLSGTWDVRVNGSKGWSADIYLPGMVWFGGRSGVRMDNLAGKLNVRNTEKLVPAFKQDNVTMDLQGKTSLDISKNSVRMSQGHYELPGAVFDGNVEATIGRSPTLEGSFVKARVDLPRATPLIREKTVSYPKFLEHLTLASVRVKLTDHDVTLEHFATHVDGIPVRGKLALNFAKEKPHVTFNLHTGSLNLDTYIGEKKKGQAQNQAQNPQHKRWDFPALREFSAQGTLKLDSLRVKKVTITNVQLPMTLANGQLDVPRVTGIIYGGEFTGKGRVSFERGVAFSSTLKVTQLDLGALLKDREIKGIFRGRTDFAATLASSMQGPGELARNLNGRLSFQTGQGSYQSVDKNLRPKGKPTVFNRAGCTGQISGGILRTNDFALMGPELRLTGSGWIDLAKETLDMNFVADMNNLPNIPLRLHGTFEHPETDIKGGMVILNAIGGIFTGIFGFLGDMLGGIIGIFS